MHRCACASCRDRGKGTHHLRMQIHLVTGGAGFLGSHLIDRLMNGDHTGPINLGNPDEFTIRELAELVRMQINPELRMVEKPLPEDDPQQRQPAIDLARQQLNWQPTVSLEQGLPPTIDSFRNLLELADGCGT